MCLKEGKEGEKLKRCSKCKVVKYCSAECQREDWALHKAVCRKVDVEGNEI